MPAKKWRKQALFESLHLFSDIQGGYTSASHLACHASCHGAAELRHLGRAGRNSQNKGTGRTWTLAGWLPSSSTNKPFLLRKSMCLHLCFQVQSGKFSPLVVPESSGKGSCGGAWVPRLLDRGGQKALARNKTKGKMRRQGGGDTSCFQRPWALLDLS